jgi:hypothetical protein
MMNKLTGQKQVIDKTVGLVYTMQEEIDYLRSVVARYHSMHGGTLLGGYISVPDEHYFDARTDVDGTATCKLVDASEVGMESRYQRIQRFIRELS